MKKLILISFLCLCAFYSVNAQYKLDENFSSATFPPTGWSIGPAIAEDSGLPVWTRSAANGYALTGTGSAFCNFYSWSGATNASDSLISPIFTSASASDTLTFDHAYRTYQTEVDDLKIYVSSNGGATWALLIDLPGGPTVGTGMVTAAASTTNFTAPTGVQWLTKKYVVGAGVNRIKFQVTTAYGNNLFVDNVKVGVPPSVDAAVTSIALSGNFYTTSGSGSAVSQGTVKNNSFSPATFSVKRTISPGGYTDTQIISGLAGNTSQTVTFAPFNYTSNTNYTVRDSIILAGDTNPSNDTLTAFFRFNTPKNTAIFNLDSRSKDSIVAHLNLLGLSNTYDILTAFPGIGLNNWRTVIVLIGSSATWAANLRDSLKAYLDGASDPSNKKSMIIFGNDLGYVNDPRQSPAAAPADTVFYRQYLHAQYWADAWTTLFPLSDSTIKGTSSPFSSVSAQRVNDPFPDCISPAYWNTGSGTLTPAFIPVTESGNGDSCTAVAFSGQYYNVFYGSNVYSSYVPTVTGLMTPQGGILQAIKGFIEINLGALPVELASFNSTVDNRNIKLNWTTNSEQNNSGFDIERKLVSGNVWSRIANVPGAGNSNIVRNYSYADNNLGTGRFNYRLKQIDFNGNYHYYDLSNEVVVGIPVRFNLAQNYPNPFNPSTKINYDLPFDSKVAIKLFDLTGREVASLVNSVQTAGYYTVSFNASSLSSGIYFYQISADGGNQNFVKTMKMVLVK